MGFFFFSLFLQWHIKLYGLFNTKSILVEDQQWYYLTQSLGNKMVHDFHKDTDSKVNVMARPELKYVSYEEQ